MTEVLIIGAGPAGSAAAIHLARAGHAVLLVDRCRFPRRKPCGEYYNPEAVRLLAQLGVLDRVLAAGAARVSHLSFRAPCGDGLSMPFERIGGPGTYAVSLGREVLDTLLVEEAQRAGATLWEGALVREPLREGNRVVGAVVRRDGVGREVRARVTLAADGLRSRFARRLGLGAGDGRRRKLGITGRVPAVSEAAELVAMQAGFGGCCGLVVRGGEVNVATVIDARESRRVGGDPARFLREEIARYPGVGEVSAGDPEQVMTVGPLTWNTRRQWAPGCMLLGDAAGFYDPFTGQGVTFALLTAQLAGEAGLQFLATGDDQALSSYARRRQALLGPKILVQQVIQTVIERPRLLQHVLSCLNRREETARVLLGTIADRLPANHALRPRFLAGLVL